MELDEQIIKDICILNGEEARQCLGKNPFYCRLLLKTSSCQEGFLQSIQNNNNKMFQAQVAVGV